LTESHTIYKNGNRRGFQSKSDFLAILRIRGPGDPLFAVLDLRRGLFYINPSRRGGGSLAGARRGLGPPPRRGEVRGPPGGPGRPQVPGDPGGNRGAPPRGVDVKPLLRRCPGPRSGTPGPRDPGSGDPGQGPPRGLGGHPSGSREPRPGGLRDLVPRIPRDPGNRARDPKRAPPAPGGGVVLHQPLAAGPRGSRRESPGTRDATER